MIEINLLPEELKKKKKKRQVETTVPKIDFGNLPILNIAAIMVGALVAIQILLFIIGVIGGASYSALEKNYNKIRPEKMEAEKIKLEIASMSKKVSVIDELMVKRFSWAKKLNDLSDSMTPGIWLTKLDYDERMGEVPRNMKTDFSKKKEGAESAKPAMEKVMLRYLTLSGRASSKGEEGMALIGRFIQNLKSNNAFYSDFSDIELGTIKREKADDQEVMDFKITCLFKIK